MNPLDRLYAQFSQEDKADKLKALATKVVVNKTPLSEIPTEHRNAVEKIIYARGKAVQQVIMWS